MNLEEYRLHRQRTKGTNLSLKDEHMNAALGLGEAGELQNIVKKEFFHSHPKDVLKVLEEAGDILYYLDWALELYGWTLEQAMIGNVNKLKDRYPDGFDPERSIHRDG